MILTHAKPFNEKMRNNLLKKKWGKKHVSHFQHLQSMISKQRRITNLLVDIKNT